MRPARPEHWVALVTVQLLFGFFPVAAKSVLAPVGPLDPYSLLAIRVGGATFCLLVLHLLLVRNPIPIRQHGAKVAGLALLGVILNMGLFMVGLQMTTATEAVLVITTIPVFTYAMAVLLGRERVGPTRAAGIVVAIAGVVTLVGFHPTHAAGDALVLLNALSYAAFLVLAKPLTERYDALSLTTWIFLAGTLVFVPVGLAHGLRGELALLSVGGLLWMAFIVLGASVLTYALNTLMLRHVASSTVAAFTYVQPVFTAIAAWLVLHEKPTWKLAPAAALVFAGVWLVARRPSRVLEGTMASE
ncbi:MAG: DMT family transporter [Thermoplasmatota archaeon]